MGKVTCDEMDKNVGRGGGVISVQQLGSGK